MGSSLALGGFGLGLAYALVGGGWVQVPRLVAASLSYVPAVSVLTGLAVALFGFAPRWSAAGWMALSGCLVIGMFGSLFDLPSWVFDLSPFQHVPGLPAASFRVLPLVAPTSVAAGLTAAGMIAFRRRDLATA